VFLVQNKVTIIAIPWCTQILVFDAQETTYEHQTSLLSSAVISTPLNTLGVQKLRRSQKNTFLWDVTPCFSLGNKEKEQRITFRLVILCGL
jgi:hypothetical protein